MGDSAQTGGVHPVLTGRASPPGHRLSGFSYRVLLSIIHGSRREYRRARIDLRTVDRRPAKKTQMVL